MRTRARVDGNQAEIVAALRVAGCSVQSLASIGKGCPDLLVGKSGVNVLLEVKDEKQPLSKRALTYDERHWHGGWQGKVYMVESPTAALLAVSIAVAEAER
jgi:hypothetical protein